MGWLYLSKEFSGLQAAEKELKILQYRATYCKMIPERPTIDPIRKVSIHEHDGCEVSRP